MLKSVDFGFKRSTVRGTGHHFELLAAPFISVERIQLQSSNSKFLPADQKLCRYAAGVKEYDSLENSLFYLHNAPSRAKREMIFQSHFVQGLARNVISTKSTLH